MMSGAGDSSNRVPEIALVHRRKAPGKAAGASPPRFHAVRRGRVTTIAVSIMIAWHLVADVEMGITLGILAWLLWPGKAA